jgi:hypothetical protein
MLSPYSPSTLENRVRLDSPLLLGGAATVLLGTVAATTTPYMTVATLAYLCMLAAMLIRGNRRLHGRLMGIAMLLDVGLVLFLEVTRHATGTAAGGRLSPFQLMHVGTSTLAVLLYGPLLWMGLRALRGRSSPSLRSSHRLLGMGAFLFRTAGFLLMFSMLSRGNS